MMNDVTEFLYKYVMNNNPFIHEEDIVSYEALNNKELIITFKNGTKEIFDTFANSSHIVSHIDHNDDESMRKAFRRKLQSIMNQKWVTQDELARRINSSQPMVSRYLTGQSIPSAITMKKIADALGVAVDELYDDYY